MVARRNKTTQVKGRSLVNLFSGGDLGRKNGSEDKIVDSWHARGLWDN